MGLSYHPKNPELYPLDLNVAGATLLGIALQEIRGKRDGLQPRIPYVANAIEAVAVATDLAALDQRQVFRLYGQTKGEYHEDTPEDFRAWLDECIAFCGASGGYDTDPDHGTCPCKLCEEFRKEPADG